MKKSKASVARSAGRDAGASAKSKRVPNRGEQPTVTGRRAAKDVNEYIAAAPEPARSRLKEMRAVIRSAVPAEAVEITSYGVPAFRSKRVLVWYAAFLKHCSLFPTASVIEEFKHELAGFTTSKGTVQFPLDKALPRRLIKKLVKARVAKCEKAQRN